MTEQKDRRCGPPVLQKISFSYSKILILNTALNVVVNYINGSNVIKKNIYLVTHLPVSNRINKITRIIKIYSDGENFQ